MPVSYRYAGFTLIELLVTLAVAAIILTIAVPSFQGLIERNQLTTEANTLAAALQTARSEAVKLGQDVSLSAGGISFAAGFCVHSGASCTTATQIREYGTLSSKASTTPASVTVITFNGMGERVTNPNEPNEIVDISPAGCTSGKADGMRRVTVSLSGQVRVSSEDCA